MEPISAEERLVTERLKQKLNEVNIAVETHFSGITDHVNFTLQEKLQRAMLVCQDKLEASKLQMNRSEGIKDLESCVDQSVQNYIQTLPHIVGRLKSRLGMTDPV
ncbi:unnamed protein product [Cuscuta epithymum]|uniref:Uncharacterized protein n=1 Tax=Cuscuta epithymum TaxID=186058 RepID=A0AAV0EDZ5_9ASTE|nr:unnamed protein product [Cuscuta epithymum]